MIAQTTVHEEVDTEQESKLYQQERLIFQCTELVCELMEMRGIKQVDLSRRLGMSSGNISQLLSGGRNMTLRSFADMLWAMDASAQVRIEDITIDIASKDGIYTK